MKQLPIKTDGQRCLFQSSSELDMKGTTIKKTNASTNY